jgi:hypothetical protein
MRWARDEVGGDEVGQSHSKMMDRQKLSSINFVMNK